MFSASTKIGTEIFSETMETHKNLPKEPIYENFQISLEKILKNISKIYVDMGGSETTLDEYLSRYLGSQINSISLVKGEILQKSVFPDTEFYTEGLAKKDNSEFFKILDTAKLETNTLDQIKSLVASQTRTYQDLTEYYTQLSVAMKSHPKHTEYGNLLKKQITNHNPIDNLRHQISALEKSALEAKLCLGWTPERLANWREEEADEYGLEYYLKAGWDPKYIDYAVGGPDFNAEECLNKNPNGDIVRGTGSHPRPCWRVHNFRVTEISYHAEDYRELLKRATRTELSPGALEKAKAFMKQKQESNDKK